MAKRDAFKAAADEIRPVSLLEELTGDAPVRTTRKMPNQEWEKEEGNVTSKMVIERESVSDGLKAIQEARKPSVRLSARSGGRPAIPKAVREHAESLAATPAKNVSYKIPGGIDEWLAVYQFRHRVEKVLKQDLIALALTRFIEQVEAEEGIMSE